MDSEMFLGMLKLFNESNTPEEKTFHFTAPYLEEHLTVRMQRSSAMHTLSIQGVTWVSYYPDTFLVDSYDKIAHFFNSDSNAAPTPGVVIMDGRRYSVESLLDIASKRATMSYKANAFADNENTVTHKSKDNAPILFAFNGKYELVVLYGLDKFHALIEMQQSFIEGVHISQNDLKNCLLPRGA